MAMWSNLSFGPVSSHPVVIGELELTGCPSVKWVPCESDEKSVPGVSFAQ